MIDERRKVVLAGTLNGRWIAPLVRRAHEAKPHAMAPRLIWAVFYVSTMIPVAVKKGVGSVSIKNVSKFRHLRGLP
jgi:hypothetical protein